MHDFPDVRDVKLYARVLAYVLLQLRGRDPTAGCLCDYSVDDILRNSSGPSASGKITEALQAPVVEAAQPVTDPVWATSLDVGSLLHGHVAHAHHAHHNHSGSDLVVLFLFVRLFEFFQFGVVHVSLEGA